LVTTKVPRFTNVEYADMYFVCGFCDGNFLAVLRDISVLCYCEVSVAA
jgi:hypothetical protein